MLYSPKFSKGIFVLFDAKYFKSSTLQHEFIECKRILSKVIGFNRTPKYNEILISSRDQTITCKHGRQLNSTFSWHDSIIGSMENNFTECACRILVKSR